MRQLFSPIIGVLVGLLLVASTTIACGLMMLPALAKLLLHGHGPRKMIDATLNSLASGWIAVNNGWMALLGADSWSDPELPPLHARGWYLVISNNSSWVDILVLQRLLHRRIPFLKFFLKQELIWVPLIGLAWWALDFPFLKRGKGRAAHQSDIEATRAACARFEHIPTSVINFIEGGRFSVPRARKQGSPYRNLLKPHIGGITIALASLGQLFEAVLDITIVYPDGTPTFWDLMCGRVARVIVQVDVLPVPALEQTKSARGYDRQVIAKWVDERWRAKDDLIEALSSAPAPAVSVSSTP